MGSFLRRWGRILSYLQGKNDDDDSCCIPGYGQAQMACYLWLILNLGMAAVCVDTE